MSINIDKEFFKKTAKLSKCSSKKCVHVSLMNHDELTSLESKIAPVTKNCIKNKKKNKGLMSCLNKSKHFKEMRKIMKKRIKEMRKCSKKNCKKDFDNLDKYIKKMKKKQSTKKSTKKSTKQSIKKSGKNNKNNN